MAEVRKQLPAILKEIEEVKEKQLPIAREHAELERARLRVDHNFALRHYLDSAASIISEAVTPATPSIQVSTFQSSGSDKSSAYQSAAMFLASESDHAPMVPHCVQLFVKSPIDTKTLLLHLLPSDDIERAKTIVRGKINLHDARFKFAHAGRVLDDRLTLQDYDIPQDSTLTCVSFRPKPMLSLTVTGSRETYEINIVAVEPKDVVGYIKDSLFCLSGVSRDHIRLIYAGQHLEEGSQIMGDASQFDRHIQMYSSAPTQPKPLDSPQLTHLVPSLPKPSEPPLPKPSNPPQQTTVRSNIKRRFSSKWQAPLGVPWLPPKRRYYGFMVQ